MAFKMENNLKTEVLVIPSTCKMMPPESDQM